MPCKLGCKEDVPRCQMANHIAHACPLKPVTCPFAKLGCMTPLVAETLPRHLDEAMPSHLLLALDVITKQQTSIEQLTSKMAAMEERGQQYEAAWDSRWSEAAARITAASAGVASIDAATKAAQAEVSEATRNVSKLQKESTASATRLKEISGSLTGLRTEQQGQKSAARALNNRVDSVVALVTRQQQATAQQGSPAPSQTQSRPPGPGSS